MKRRAFLHLLAAAPLAAVGARERTLGDMEWAPLPIEHWQQMAIAFRRREQALMRAMNPPLVLDTATGVVRQLVEPDAALIR